MPRNSSGIYFLPSSDVNPPVSGTTINPVSFAAELTDVANEITNSLDRLGRAPMQAVLQMAGFRVTNIGAPVALTDAARLADFGTYLPPGALGFFSQKIAPSGWAVADGSTISRAGNPVLFASYNADGLIYGVGDGSTTFNLPNYQGAGFRSWDNGRGLDPSRVFGSYQADTFAAHTHVQNPHIHVLTDPSHAHGYTSCAVGTFAASGGLPVGEPQINQTTAAAATGITLAATTAVNQNAGALETVGKNYAVLVCIRLG